MNRRPSDARHEAACNDLLEACNDAIAGVYVEPPDSLIHEPEGGWGWNGPPANLPLTRRGRVTADVLLGLFYIAAIGAFCLIVGSL